MSEITLKNISVSPPKSKVKRSLASRGRLKLGKTGSQNNPSPVFDQPTNRPSKILSVEIPTKELTLVVNGVRESISISPDRSARKRSTLIRIPLEGRRFSSVGNHLNGIHKLQANTPELKKTAEDPQDFKSLAFMRGLVNNWRRNLDDLTNEELTELAIFILKKDPETRAIQDTNVLTQYLLEIAFFQTFEKSLIEQCVQHLRHLILPKGSTVFYMDDPGTNMYVLLRGSVGVWSHKENEEGKEPKRKSMIETKVLSSGTVFGEHTLLNNSARPYTIICKEPCYVAVLEKQDYFNIIAQNKAEKLAEEIKFLGSISLFKFFTERALKMFASILPTEKYFRGHKVYQETEEPQSMYIVKKGEFKMLKSVIEGKNDNNNGRRESLSKLKRQQKKRKNIEVAEKQY